MSQQPHILIADDERSIRLMLETGLTLNGFRVTSARTGREALEAVSSCQFDAVLSDVYMPDGNGLDVAREILTTGAKVRVVFTSGYPIDSTILPVEMRGRVQILQKPFLPRALGELLNSPA